MSSVSGDRILTVGFLQIILAGAIFTGGVMTFTAYHDKDWKYGYEGNMTSNPAEADTFGPYETLSEEERELVHRSMEDGSVRVEERHRVPPEAIKTSFGHYMIFDGVGVYDYSEPGTTGPIGLIAAGIALMGHAIRRDIRSRQI
jgi:hypothetical protein